MAITELSPEQRVKLFRQLRDRFNRQIASQLVNHPPVRRRGDYYVADTAPAAAPDDVPPTDDQLKAVRSAISEYSVPYQMIGVAVEQRGLGGGKAAIDLLCRFFQASGMIHRLRCHELQRQHRNSNARGRPDYSHVPAVWPQWINFWTTPAIGYNSRLEGTNSVDGLHRDDLIEVAVEFYRIGIRYPLFEKYILEALLHAELCGTVKMARQGAFGTTFTERILKGWSFDKTQGDEPLYSMYFAGGYVLRGAVSLGLFAAAVVWALTSYTTEPTWKNTSALAVLVLIGTSVVGRWLVRRIVKWAQPDASISTAQLLRKHPAARAITQLETLTKIVSAPVLSITLARDAARRCYSDGGFFDQIVMSYLDRADVAGELVWTNHYRAYEFDEYADQGDLEASEAQ
ncbi:MAG: hypothetical protein JWN43_3512 [Gammaproteobacteria bacterium]|nr:hypothetical protein [Gammaproteobacteria bacterium]